VQREAVIKSAEGSSDKVDRTDEIYGVKEDKRSVVIKGDEKLQEIERSQSTRIMLNIGGTSLKPLVQF